MKGADGLYPIVRRIRRPLLPVEPPAENKPAAVSQPESKPAAAVDSEVVEEKKTDASESNK
jgi:hypothetical protein